MKQMLIDIYAGLSAELGHPWADIVLAVGYLGVAVLVLNLIVLQFKNRQTLLEIKDEIKRGVSAAAVERRESSDLTLRA